MYKKHIEIKKEKKMLTKGLADMLREGFKGGRSGIEEREEGMERRGDLTKSHEGGNLSI